MSKLNDYANKYRTPRGFQVFVTIIILYTLSSFMNGYPYRFYDLSAIDTTGDGWEGHIWNVYPYCFGDFGYSLAIILKTLCWAAAVSGIVFLWMNRPIFTLCSSLPYIVTFVLSSPRFYECYGERSSDIAVKSNYSGGALILLLLIQYFLFSVFAVLTTKKVMRHIPVKVINEANDAIPVSPVTLQVSTPEELRKYKQLLDEGIITQEEFDAKKKQLLGLPNTYTAPATPQSIGKCPQCGRENVSFESIEVVVAGMSRKRTMCAECAAKYKSRN